MKRNILVHILLLMSFLSAAQVGINTDTPDDGSALQIESTTGGLAPPRMNTSQMLSIPTPLEGSIIFKRQNLRFLFSTMEVGNQRKIILALYLTETLLALKRFHQMAPSTIYL